MAYTSEHTPLTDAQKAAGYNVSVAAWNATGLGPVPVAPKSPTAPTSDKFVPVAGSPGL